MYTRKFEGIVFSKLAPAAQALMDVLQNDGEAERTPEGFLLTDQRVAQLSPWELRLLELPDAAPFRLQVRGAGLITSPAFGLTASLFHPNGQPLMGARRDGVLIKTGSRTFTILEPLYRVLVQVEKFAEATDMDSRMQSWAQIQAALPEDAVVDQQLKTIHLVTASRFTLDVGTDGDINPVLLTHPTTEQLQDGQDSTFQEALPEAFHETFARSFRMLASAKSHYALGGGWYVIVPETTRKALDVVHRFQKRSEGEKRAFIANPQKYVNENMAPEDEALFDAGQLFVEMPSFLSSRVQCLGEWVPKLSAYLPRRNIDWLPDDPDAFAREEKDEPSLGLVIGDVFIDVKASAVPDLIRQMEEALAQGHSNLRFGDTFIPANTEALEQLINLVESAGRISRKHNEKISSEEQQSHDARLVPKLIDNIDELGYRANKRQTLSQPGGLPANLRTTTLFPHQKNGIRWLQEAWAEGMPGVLLADDMGLGKTLQVLTFLAWLNEERAQDKRRKPHLIVAPTGLLRNWQAEVNLHLLPPGLGTVLQAHGSELRGIQMLGSFHRKQRLEEAQWVLTTYETLRDQIFLFLPIDWCTVVFDEAQKIKNPASRTTEMAKSLKSDFVVTITGTPVENTLADLWSIIDASHAGLLGSLRQFREEYQKPAEESGDLDAGKRLRERLELKIKPPAILRRTKEDSISGLPAKYSHILTQNMTSEQANAYAAVLRDGMIARKEGGKGAILEVIQALRRVSLFATDISRSGIDDTVIQSSARGLAMMQQLEKIQKAGEKVLIFIEYLTVQEALIPYLQQKFQLANVPLRISGKSNASARQNAVDAFQARPEGQFDIMLLSPKAGGVGLTLTAANHVIHLTRWWNPAVEDQCTDRVYRIGQRRDVHVYYPQAIYPGAAEKSFDRSLHTLLEQKRCLSQSVFASPIISESELENMLNEIAL